MSFLGRFLGRLFGHENSTVPAPEALNTTVAPEEAAAPEAAEEQPQPIQTRPLEPLKPFISKKPRITYGSATDVGRVRSNNQDACLTLLATADMVGNPAPIGLFIVADGMGGHHDGELASAVTVQTVVQHVIDDIILPHLEGREQTSEQKTIPEALFDAMNAANQVVQMKVPSGGTTATCAVLRGNLAFIAHVGDSRAYLLTEDNFELITRDHSLVRRLQELGQLTEAEAEVHPHRNVLYRAIGQGDSLEVDATTRRLPPSSRLLLCSDGLWGMVSEETIVRTLTEVADPQRACELLVEAANQNGGADNITAVLIQMPD
ncbi:MAG: protein phosphatase 2C domain-containing protein [Anaerolineae bacterium]